MEMKMDIGLTHIALPVSDIEQSVQFYATYAAMKVVHRRIDAETGVAVVWLSDQTRPFVIVLIQSDSVHPVLSPLAHLGVGCPNREAMDALCERAEQEGVLLFHTKSLAIRSDIGLSYEIRMVTRLNYPMDRK